MDKIFTIGVYNTTEELFFNALIENDIDLFCDIRQRRGVRGKTYTYVNSTYLQAKLQDYSIDYLHYKNLAPTKDIREAQKVADKQNKVATRKRTLLDDVFVTQYREHILSQFDIEDFVSLVKPYKTVCLFCVECLPDACHRSLAAAHINKILNVAVEHLTPCQKRESS